jgi:shikimate dehydrogenase
MILYGLIGKTLSHSFSKNYFEEKFLSLGLNNHTYQNFELQSIEQIEEVFLNTSLIGLNVTIPYKESVISFLDQLSDEAQAIGAVNCIKIKDGKRIGFNTDFYGFGQSIKPFLDSTHQKALILGTGGAARAVAYALRKTGIEVFFVSSSEKKDANILSYHQINNVVMDMFKLIINATPLGMLPDTEQCPDLPYELFTQQHLAYDLIYKQNGALVINGLSMLRLQAEKSWEIWSTL